MDKEKIQLIKYLKKNISDISALTPKERTVLRVRFGLDDGVMRSLEATGKVVGVSRERVRQLQNKALDIVKEWQKA